MTATFPRAIVHLDGDAFFASVEQAIHPELKDKPIITGKERGIVACANYPAKACGIRRGVPLHKAKQMCPELVILPNDYETYGIFSQRMFEIMRRYTPVVEEYSIDEAFADITGLCGLHRMSYEKIAQRMRSDIHAELGITVSAGLSLSKALAKLCSKFRKPDGMTAVPGRFIHVLLTRTPLDTVWGFGPNTVSLLKKQGLNTAYDFVMRPERWASRLLHKPGRELWSELRGHSVWDVKTESDPPQATIIKSKTFAPPSRDRDYIYARLVRNVESAFMKARRYHRSTGVIGVVLRRQDFQHEGLEVRLNRPTSSTMEVLPIIRHLFDRIIRSGCDYRATIFVMARLSDDRVEQLDLFEDRLKIDTVRNLTTAVDAINKRYGKHTIHVASTLPVDNAPPSPREELPQRRHTLMKGENARQRLAIPYAHIKV